MSGSNGNSGNGTELRLAAIYARVSTEDQADGYSLPSQVETCQTLAVQQRYTVPEQYIFQEDYTGKVLDRPLLPRLRELVRTQAVQAVMVYDPDRLARRFALQVILEEELDQAGVKLLYVNHTRDETPEGRALGYMRGVFAEIEREKIMERTSRGRLYRAKAGHVSGGQTSLGYRAIREPHKARWKIEPDEADLVRRIYAMCLSGMSTYAIALQLTRERVPTRGDRPGASVHRVLQRGVWQASTVHRILTNEAYLGRTYVQKYRRVGTRQIPRPREEWIGIPVPVILDAATFQAVQHQLVRNRDLSPRNKKRDYLFTGGFLRCGRCGRAMIGGAYRHSRRYVCSTAVQVLDPTARCRGQVKADTVEQQVWDAVVRLLEQPDLIAAEVTRQQATADEERDGIRRELATIESALAKCEKEAQRWADAYAAEVISLEELKAYRADLGARRQSLLAQQAERQGTLAAIGQAVQQVEGLIDYCIRVRQSLHTFDMPEKRRAFEALSLRARWTPGQPLVIQGSIPTESITPTRS